MLLLFILPTLLLSVNTVKGLDIFCCQPDYMKGAIYKFEEGRTEYFVIDFPAKLSMKTFVPYGPDFNITDFNEGIQYVFNEYGCSAGVFFNPLMYQQCLRGTPQVYSLIDYTHGVEVEAFDSHADAFASRIGVTRHNGVCYPAVLYNENGVNGYKEIHFFHDVTEFHDSQDFLREHVKNCKDGFELF